MKGRSLVFTAIVIPILMAAAINDVFGARYYSRKNGSWASSTTWSTTTYNGPAASSVPAMNDSVYVSDGHLITIDAAASCKYVSLGQGTSGKMNYSGSGRVLTIHGDLIVNPGGVFKMFVAGSAGNTLILKGSLYNNGIFEARNGVVVLNGSQPQALAGNVVTLFYNLLIQNSSGVKLYNSIEVENQLELNQGKMELNRNTVYIQNSVNSAIIKTGNSYIVSEMDSSVSSAFIKWKLRNDTGTYIFPFGYSDTEYIPVVLSKKSTTGYTISISTRSTATCDNKPCTRGMDLQETYASDYVVDRWWDISTDANSVNAGEKLTLTYRGAENTLLPTNLRTDSLMTRYWDGSKFSQPMGTAIGSVAATGSISASGLFNLNTSFIVTHQAFVLAASNRTLDAEYKTDHIRIFSRDLEPSTHEKLISLYRISYDKKEQLIDYAIHYDEDTYEYHDPTIEENAYYIIRVESTGKFYEYGPVKPLKRQHHTVKVYPNPASERLIIEGPDVDMRSVRMIDVCNRECAFQISRNKNLVEIDLQGLPKGTYILKYTENEEEKIHTVFKH